MRAPRSPSLALAFLGGIVAAVVACQTVPRGAGDAVVRRQRSATVAAAAQAERSARQREVVRSTEEESEPVVALGPQATEDVSPPLDAVLDEVPASGEPLTRPAPPTRHRQGDRPREQAAATVLEAGHPEGTATREEAESRGLVVVDLGDAWVPFLLSPDASLGEQGQQPYVATYRALAAQQFGEGEEFDRARSDRFLELYGITPTFGVLATRLADDDRHACHAAVDDAPLGAVDRVMVPFGNAEERAAQADLHRQLAGQLARAEARARAAGSQAGPATEPGARADAGSATEPDGAVREPASLLSLRRRFAEVHAKVGPVLAVQAHLRCEGLLSRRAAYGIYDAYTGAAVGAYQRLHMVPSRSGFLDAPTRAVFLEDSRELDFRSVLRALRERVVDATGLIEDGSASASWGTVFERALEPRDFRAFSEEPPLPDAAPDLISPATEAAARALGWTSFEGARAFFESRGAAASTLLVALRLPEPPDYHRPHMELRAEIDRGDIWYDYPYTATGQLIPQPVVRRARLVVYAHDGERELALVRWPTTVGGWEEEQLPDGHVGLKYKNSDVGPRVWRDLVASPAWLPPGSTPDEDLLRRDPLRGWRVKRDAFGPGFASAYGLVMLVQHVVVAPREEGEPVRYLDRGIRSHGSANYASILRGTSHGCHRLFNHLAIRLGGFMLAHRDHVRHGPEPVAYQRRVRAHGRAFELRIDSRGVRTELVPPVPVRVLPGNVLGYVQTPPTGIRALPSALVARARAAAAVVDE